MEALACLRGGQKDLSQGGLSSEVFNVKPTELVRALSFPHLHLSFSTDLRILSFCPLTCNSLLGNSF